MARKTSKKVKKAAPREENAFDWQDDPRPRLPLRGFFKFALVASIWACILLGMVVAWYAADLPRIVKNTVFERQPSITIKAADGSVIARYGDLKGQTVTIQDMPKNLVHAVVAIEDRRFYSHHGIDILGLARAMFVNVREGGIVQGGSTVTQQLAKNLFLTQDRTYHRKIQEALLAVWLEHELTKDEIMAAYLNRVYMGAGAYGVEAAANVYYGKRARDLDLMECATLAGLLKAPSRYSPASSPQAARDRARIVLKAMLDSGYITKKQYDQVAVRAPVAQAKPSNGDTERYYGDWVVSRLVDLIGEPDKDVVVETTLWPDSQRAAENAVNRVLSDEGAKKHATQSAVVMMDIDGAVHVMVGGRDYGKSQFNRATQALRQPGSSFKPVVYLTALEAGWKPDDIIDDKPIAVGKYHPANFKNEYYGPVPLHFALSRSLNSAAIQLIQYVGPDKVAEMASQLGIRTKLDRNLSLALGSSGVPVIEMVTAYATIANAGVGVDPYAITRITDTNGKVLYQHRQRAVPLQVVNPVSVQELASMMQETIDEGTGQRARLPYLAAGKTGTSQDYRDAWFMGFSGRFAAGAWVGNDDNSSMKAVTGGSLPAAIWKDVMLAAYQEAQAKGIPTQGPVQLNAPYDDQAYYGEGAPVMRNPDDAYVPPHPESARREPRTFGELLQSIFSF